MTTQPVVIVVHGRMIDESAYMTESVALVDHVRQNPGLISYKIAKGATDVLVVAILVDSSAAFEHYRLLHEFGSFGSVAFDTAHVVDASEKLRKMQSKRRTPRAILYNTTVQHSKKRGKGCVIS